MEPRDVDRYKRHAAALGKLANDAEGVAQMMDIISEFEHQAALTVERLRTEQGMSWAYLASATPQWGSAPAIRQWVGRRLRRQP